MVVISYLSVWYEASQLQQWLQTECHTSCRLHKYMSNHKYLYGNDGIMVSFAGLISRKQ